MKIKSKIIFCFLVLVILQSVAYCEETSTIANADEPSVEYIESQKNEPTTENPPDWVPSTDEEEVSEESNKDSNEVDPEEIETEQDIKEQSEIDELENLPQEELEEKLRIEEREFAAKIKEEMGIYKMKEITKETFREYMTKIILSTTEDEEATQELTEEDNEEEEFLNLLIEEIMINIPDKFPVEKFDELADTDRYKYVVDKILKDKFGENYSDEIMKMMQGQFDATKEGMPNFEEMEEMAKKEEQEKQERRDRGEEVEEEREEEASGNEEEMKDFANMSQEDIMGQFAGLKDKLQTEGDMGGEYEDILKNIQDSEGEEGEEGEDEEEELDNPEGEDEAEELDDNEENLDDVESGEENGGAVDGDL